MITPKQSLVAAIAFSALSAALVGYYAQSRISRLESTISGQAEIIRKFEASVAQAQSVFAAQAEAQRNLAVLQGEVKAASLSLAQEAAKIAALTQESQATTIAQREALLKIGTARDEFQRHIKNFVVDRKNLIDGVQTMGGQTMDAMNLLGARVTALEEATTAKGKGEPSPQPK